MSVRRTAIEKIARWGKSHAWLCVAALAIIALAWHVRGDRLAIPTMALLCIIAALAWRHRIALQREHRSQTAAEEARHHQHAVLTAMHETSLALMNRSDLTDVLATIVTRAGAFFGAPHGFVVLVQPDGGTLRSAYDTGCFLSVRELPIYRGEGFSGKVWETGKPVVVDNYPAWEGRLAGAADLPIHAAVGVPLSAGGCLLGVLGLAREEPGTRFLDHEVALLKQFAQLAAIAIDNARLFRESQTSAAQYRLLFESNPQPMWVYDTETLRFLAVNNAALAHYGYTRDEFLAMTTEEIRPPEEVARLYGFLAEHATDYDPSGVWRHCKSDGTPIDMETTSHAIDFDGRPARIVLAIDVTERECALKALQQSEARFRAQYQGNPVAIFTWQRADDEYVFIDYNTAANTMAHGNVRNLLGKTARACYGELPEVLENLGRADREQRIIQHETVWTFAHDSEPTNLLVTHVPVPPDLVMLHSEDITERKRAVAGLRESEERYRSLIELSPDAIFVHSHGQFLFANEAAVRLLGASSADAVVGGSISAVVHPDDRAAAQARVRAGYEEGIPVAPVEMRIVREDGQVIETEIASTPITFEGEQAMLSVLRDVSERKRAEERLRLLESVAVHSRDAVLITAVSDAETLLAAGPQIVYVNDAFTQMTGYTAAETIGRSPRFLQGPETDQATLATVRDAMLREETHAIELINYRKDGTPFWLEMSLVPVRDAHGHCTHFISVQRDITAWKQAQEQLVYNAMHDALTGLANRAAFVERLRQALERVQGGAERPFAVLFVDCDRFKTVNDSLGHVEGDRLLSSIAHRLMAHLNPGWEVARLGGDEFAILVEDIAGVEDAVHVAERVHAALASPFRLRGHEVSVTASIGIALGSATYRQPEEILRDADTAMYRAKASGRGRHVVFDDAMHERAVTLLQLESDLRRTIERDQLHVLYQPIMGLETGDIVGFEALLRWRHPLFGLLTPADFIALAEETGQIIALDRWILRQACRQMRTWDQRFPHLPELTMSVNISGKHVARPDFLEYATTILATTGLDARRLRLEITESALIEHSEAAVAALWQARAAGIQVQLDDFGTGYSSLSYLHRFPIDMLKIDRSFISSGEVRIANTEIIRAIVTLAQNLHIGVTAEGVETVEQVAQLRTLGCTYGQGYYFSPPLDAQMAERLLTRHLPTRHDAAAS